MSDSVIYLSEHLFHSKYWEASVKYTSITLPPFVNMHVPSPESERFLLPVSMIFLMNVGTVPTV